MRRRYSTTLGTIFSVILWLFGVQAFAQISIGSSQQVWGVNATDDVFRWNGSGWTNIPGKLSHVSAAADGTIAGVDHAGNIFRLAGNQWQPVTGLLTQISVGSAQQIWGVNAVDDIFRWNGTGWTHIPGKLVHVSAGADGTVWGVNRAGNIFRRAAEQWQPVSGVLTQISVGSAQQVWGVNAVDDIFRWNGTGWTHIPSKLTHVSAAPDGTVWGVNRAGNIFRRAGDQWQPIPGVLRPAVARAQASVPQVLTVSTPLQLTMAAVTAPQKLEVTGLTSLPANAVVSGPQGQSGTKCGGAGQAPCPLKAATLVGKSSATCDAGSFFDLGKSSCWTCPAGYERSVDAVDTDRACQKRDTSVRGGFLPAKFQGPLCPEGTFHDSIRGGECWKCPAGYTRSIASVESANACVIAAHEEVSRATRQRNTIWPHECWNASQFHDIWDGGACWSCPSGFNRTAAHVNSENACARTAPEQQKTAQLDRKAQCGAGEFFDLKIPGQQNAARGGGCWTCPPTTTRTIAAVDSLEACEKPAQLTYQKATMVKSINCGADALFDPINGGTCWKCPTGTKRYVYKPINGAQACESPGIDWQSATYQQPGLFGLQGAEEVALALVKDGVVINQMADAVAAEKQKPAAEVRRAIWQEIATDPRSSDVLRIAVLSRLAVAAKNPAQATADEVRLIKGTQDEIRKFRVFMAQDALNAYDAWKAGDATRNAYYKTSALEQLVNMGEVPPDFEQITADTIFSGLAAGGAVGTAGMMAMTNATVLKSVFPFASRARWVPDKVTQAAKATFEAARAGRGTYQAANLATKAAGEVAAGAAKLGGGVAGSFLSAGPQIIIGLAAEILAIAIEQQIDKVQARPKLLTGLATAQNVQIDFARMLTTPAGTAELENFWTILTAGTNNVLNPAVFRALAEPRAKQ